MSSDCGITIPVDLSNPGQFFACCGLLELSDRLWPTSSGWFESGRQGSAFHIATPHGGNLRDLLAAANQIQFDVAVDGGSEEEGADNAGDIEPLIVTSPVPMVLDWWSDKSIKPWAGSMKERPIFFAMLRAIDPIHRDPFNDLRAVLDPIGSGDAKRRQRPGKKREPFYFDCRRGASAHPLDSGFSPDTHHLESECCPAVEAMCFIGLQRARPAPMDKPNRSRYTAWTKPLPTNALAPFVCGAINIEGSTSYSFDNCFRTDQKKHKCFSRAVRERNGDA